MQISKSSWHYCFNSWMQDSFKYRARNDVFTTCSYIRTTIFSAIVGLFKIFAMILAVFVAIWMVAGVVYLPFFVFGTVGELPPLVVGGIMGWSFLAIVAVACLMDKLSPYLKRRKEKRIALLKQAMLDKSAGICTIIDFE